MDLSIIILSYNTRDITLATLRSLDDALSHEHPNFITRIETIIVDNASTDGSREALSAFAFSQSQIKSTFVQNTDNVGFSRGNNIGLSTAKGKYIMYLNSDMIVSDLQVSDLIHYLNDHEQVGALTPRVQLTSGQIDPASHRGFPTPWRSLSYFMGLEKLMWSMGLARTTLGRLLGGYHLIDKDLTTIHDIEACSGAAMLVRGDILRKLGGFDEQFFMYGEDLDLCYRIRKSGYRIIWHPGQMVTHLKYKSGISSNAVQTKRKIRWHFYDAMWLFYDKHYRKHYPYVVTIMIKMALAVVKRQYM